MLSSPTLRRRQGGFSIVEIVVIFIILALMLIIIVPHLLSELRLRKAMRVKNDLLTLSAAIEHYALDNGKVAGAHVTYGDVRKYLKPESDIYTHQGRDILGDSYGPFVVGTRPSVPEATADKLNSVAGPDFWSPFPMGDHNHADTPDPN